MDKNAEQEEAVEDFVVIHGSVKTPDGLVAVGGIVGLTVAEAKRMDPSGVSLKPKRLWDSEHAGKAAGEKAAKASLEESARKEAEAHAKHAREEAEKKAAGEKAAKGGGK